MEKKQVWLGIWRIKGYYFAVNVNWTALLRIRTGYPNPITTKCYVYNTTFGLTNAMQCRMHRKWAAKWYGSHVLLTPQENVTEPSSRIHTTLGLCCCSLEERSMILFDAARDFQLSTYRLGVTYGKFLPGPEIFLRVFSSWATLYQWCPEESATETVWALSFLLGCFPFLLWISGHTKPWWQAWRQLQVQGYIRISRMIVLASLSVGDNSPFCWG